MSQCQRSEIEIIEARNVSREQKTCRAEALVRRRRRCMVARRMWSPFETDRRPQFCCSFPLEVLHFYTTFIYMIGCHFLPRRTKYLLHLCQFLLPRNGRHNLGCGDMTAAKGVKNILEGVLDSGGDAAVAPN